MTDHARAIEAGARAIYENWANYPACSNSEPWDMICEKRDAQADDFRRKSRACIEAALASGALVPASAELSGNTGELRDRVAEAIRGDGSDLDDTPWDTLSDERKIGWRGDADRALSAVKDYLTSAVASAVAAERERCAKAGWRAAYDSGQIRRHTDTPDEVAAAIRALSPEPASGEFVVVPRADLQVVVDIAGRNESAIEIECIKEWLKDAATKDGER